MRDATSLVFGEGTGEGAVDVREGLRDAVLGEGRGPLQIILDVLRLIREPNKLSVEEYFAHRVYRSELSDAERRTYLGSKGAARLHRETVEMNYVAAGRDKLLFHQVMTGEGLPVPEIQAVYHPYRRLRAGRELRDRDDLADFMLSEARYPLFSKPVRERRSLGAQSWEGADAGEESVVTGAGERIPVDRLHAALEPFERFGYLFQERLTPDERMERICGPTLSTVRVIVLLDDRSPNVVRAGWKIPAAGSLADNYWRTGNMLASVDVETGRVGRVVRGTGAEQEVVDEHPDTGFDLRDLRFPAWERVRDLCREASVLFPGIGFQGWDVALTETGPTIVELNPIGDPILVQLAHSRGLYDAEFQEIIERCPDPSEHREWWK